MEPAEPIIPEWKDISKKQGIERIRKRIRVRWKYRLDGIVTGLSALITLVTGFVTFTPASSLLNRIGMTVCFVFLVLVTGCACVYWFLRKDDEKALRKEPEKGTMEYLREYGG